MKVTYTRKRKSTHLPENEAEEGPSATCSSENNYSLKQNEQGPSAAAGFLCSSNPSSHAEVHSSPVPEVEDDIDTWFRWLFGFDCFWVLMVLGLMHCL